jgi:beta-lactam-binding protein with PASTA domain
VSGVVLAYLFVALYVFPVDPMATPLVPNVVGDTYEDAEQKLLQAGFTVERGDVLPPAGGAEPTKPPAGARSGGGNSGSAPSKVVQQAPEAGTRQRVGTKIVLATGGGAG